MQFVKSWLAAGCAVAGIAGTLVLTQHSASAQGEKAGEMRPAGPPMGPGMPQMNMERRPQMGPGPVMMMDSTHLYVLFGAHLVKVSKSHLMLEAEADLMPRAPFMQPKNSMAPGGPLPPVQPDDPSRHPGGGGGNPPR